METRIENRLDMMHTIMSVCADNSTIIGSVPALNSAYAGFTAKMSDIDKIIVALLTEAKSITAAKRIAKKELVDNTDRVASGLRSLAHTLGDEPLMIEVRFSPAQMIHRRFDVLIGNCKNILAIAGEHQAELVDYGVSAADIVALSAAITAYEIKSQEPRKASDLKKQYNAALKASVMDVADLLKNELDPLIHILPDANATFRGTYRNARVIYDYKGKRREPAPEIRVGLIEGTITSAFDGSPVEGALVYIPELNLVVESDEGGAYLFEKVPAGKYTIEVFADTFIKAVNTSVMMGEGSELVVDFKLETEPVA
jgi:hypothetical protein